ncbi:histidine kinase dimerization/phosphoacceptor domain-containing protein [Nonomuraea sp. NPDC049649]|uniref:histidine kinase dimerization/phosphoacceptor domain-containing protein n=1 Tax=Nonomuraea sp. NPDC049649 TaxID=3155776 RepID=UPI003416B345
MTGVPGEHHTPAAMPWELRVSRAAVAMLAVAFFLRPLVELASSGPVLLRVAGVVLGVLVLVLYITVAVTGLPPGRRLWALAAMTLLAYPPLAFLGPWWTAVIFLAAMALTVLPLPYSVLGFGLVILGEVPTGLAFGDSLPEALYSALRVAMPALLLYCLARFAMTAKEMYDTRAMLMAAEVERERERVAAELHAVLGERLAELRRQGERAQAKLEGDGCDPRAELGRMLLLARDAQQEMRAFAHREQQLHSGKRAFPK